VPSAPIRADGAPEERTDLFWQIETQPHKNVIERTPSSDLPD
jgi:hypothetical protein